MSLFTYLLIAALAAAATATATGEAVDHNIRRLSSSSEDDNPYHEAMKTPLPVVGIMFAALVVIGFFVFAALLRCAFGHQNDHPQGPQAASCQPAPKRRLPLMSIEPTLNFTSGLTLAGGADHPQCTICLSEIVEGEEIRILSNCRHGFHLKCIETWLSTRSSCPTCRTSCLKTSVKNNPPDNQQQQQQNEVDLEAANPTEIEMTTATTSISIE